MSRLYWQSKYQQLWEHKLSLYYRYMKAGKSSCHWHLYLCVYLSVSVTVLPDSPNFPYRRYDRLPPISQFSIESDSDLSETAELIEEYEVFDPSRPRPKVILVIGKELEQHSTRMMPDIKIPADSCVTTRQSSKALFVCEPIKTLCVPPGVLNVALPFLLVSVEVILLHVTHCVKHSKSNLI